MPRLTTTQRGYGTAHQQVRAQWAPVVATGEACCHRCGYPLDPTQPWDMGHTEDHTAYTGPEHVRCNRSAGASRGNRMRGNWRNARW